MKNIFMNKEKINSYLIFGMIAFYFTMYCFGFVYTPLKSYFSVINIFIFLCFLFINKKEIIENKKLVILFFVELAYSVICKYVNGTGWGSILQIANLLYVIMAIPCIKIEKKFFTLMQYSIPLFFICFLVCPKDHLNPNYVGYIFFCFYIFSIIVYNLDSKGKRLYLLLATIVSLVCIYFFRCRTAMVSLFLLYLVMHLKKNVFFSKNYHKYMPLFLVFVSFLLAAVYIFLWNNNFLVDSRIFVGKSFYSGRNRIWNEILPLIFENPIFGVGSKYVLKSHATYAMHNTSFMIAMTFGLPSLIVYYFYIKDLFKRIYQNAKDNFTFVLIICVITILLFNDIFESYVYWSNYNILFFAIMISLINRNRMVEEENKIESKKKRIFIFEEGIDRVGGVERVISTLSNGFAKKYDVNVISFYKTSDEIFYKYNKGINITFLMNQKNKKSMRYGKKHPLHYVYRVYERLLDELVLLPRLSKVMNSLNNDDIVIFGRIDVALKVYPLIVNCKKIVIRDAIHYYYFKKTTQLRVKRMFKNEQINFIVSSEESKKAYLENTRIKKIYKIYNPLGIEAINKFDYSSKQIVSVGRFSSQKGFENLIRSFADVHQQNSDWKLKIVGAKSDKLQKMIDELQLSNCVQLMDKSKNIVEILNNSAIYVMTSRYEGYANALVEAMACGVPSISYNWLLGVEDIIDNKKDGLIVKLSDRFAYAKGYDDEKNIVSLSKAINSLIKDEKTCKKMASNAHKKIMKTRNIDLIIEEWEAIIDS